LTGKIETEIAEINFPRRFRHRRLLEYRWSLFKTGQTGDISLVKLQLQ